MFIENMKNTFNERCFKEWKILKEKIIDNIVKFSN